MRQLNFLVGQRCIRPLYLNLCRQPDILAGCPCPQLIGTAFHFPVLGLDVPVTESLVVQRDLNRAAFPRFQKDLCEALQLLLGTEHLCVGFCHIQLHDLGAVRITGIGHGQLCPFG